MKNIYKSKIMKKYDEDCDYNPNFSKHQLCINNHYLVCGGTGTGKTNCVVNILQQFYNTFSHLYIFTKDPDEKMYKMLSCELKEFCTIKPIHELIDYEELPREGQKMIIFDDFITENKKILSKIEKYSTMARKKYCTCFYLVQNYYACPVTIRRNLGYIILLKMADKKNLDMIIKVLPHNIPCEMVHTIVKNATKFKLNICIIDLKTNEPDRMFRRNITDFYDPYNLELFENDGIEN